MTRRDECRVCGGPIHPARRAAYPRTAVPFDLILDFVDLKFRFALQPPAQARFAAGGRKL